MPRRHPARQCQHLDRALRRRYRGAADWLDEIKHDVAVGSRCPVISIGRNEWLAAIGTRRTRADNLVGRPDRAVRRVVESGDAAALASSNGSIRIASQLAEINAFSLYGDSCAPPKSHRRKIGWMRNYLVANATAVEQQCLRAKRRILPRLTNAERRNSVRWIRAAACSDEPSCRMFPCARRRCQVVVCSRSDRGQVYCIGTCRTKRAAKHEGKLGGAIRQLPAVTPCTSSETAAIAPDRNA